MKYEALPGFYAAYARLSPRERVFFDRAVTAINRAYAGPDRWPPRWPANLCIKQVRGYSGIWEMTWSFSGPDGRATFEIVEIDREPAIRWRRIGGHEIFAEP